MEASHGSGDNTERSEEGTKKRRMCDDEKAETVKGFGWRAGVVALVPS
jgi:hypothetical protein